MLPLMYLVPLSVFGILTVAFLIRSCTFRKEKKQQQLNPLLQNNFKDMI